MDKRVVLVEVVPVIMEQPVPVHPEKVIMLPVVVVTDRVVVEAALAL
jgi:hypothetical protein